MVWIQAISIILAPHASSSFLLNSSLSSLSHPGGLHWPLYCLSGLDSFGAPRRLLYVSETGQRNREFLCPTKILLFVNQKYLAHGCQHQWKQVQPVVSLLLHGHPELEAGSALW